MSVEEKTALVERLMDALNRQDLDAAMELLHPEIEFDWSRSRGVQAGVYRGLEETRGFIEAFWDSWAEFEYPAGQLIPVGQGVVRTGGFRGIGRGSGVAVEAKGAQLAEFKGGKISRITLFQSPEDALEALRSDGPS